MHSYSAGVKGEEAAAAYLTAKGMKLLSRRYRGAQGEIDLVLMDGPVIVFAEVKARPNGNVGDGFFAISPDKKRRMISAANAYLEEYDLLDYTARFLAVEITSAGLLHIPDAFRP